MGKKVNPTLYRIGTIYTQNSRWFAKKDFATLLEQDIRIRKHLQVKLRAAAVDRVIIERTANSLTVTIYTGKPGVVIGRGGADIEVLRKELKRLFFGNQKITINVSIKEVTKPALSARIVTLDVIADLEKRVPFRRAIRSALGRVERAGAPGGKIIVAGRLNGAEIARQEMLTYGKVPLQTLRADIDYARAAAHTVYGAIGVKVWIYKGDVLEGEKVNA